MQRNSTVQVTNNHVCLSHLLKLTVRQFRFNDDAFSFLDVCRIFSFDVSDSHQDDSLIKSVIRSAPVKVCESDIIDELKIFRRFTRLSPNSKNADEVMRDLVFGQQAAVFPELTKLAAAYLLLPLGTATVERSFSSLNRIACDVRSTLTVAHKIVSCDYQLRDLIRTVLMISC